MRALQALLTIAALGWLLRSGYRRRRDVWTRRSWRRFGAMLAAAVGGFAVAMAMAVGVDRGVYDGMSPVEHHLYFFALMTLLVAAPAATVGLVLWFAHGRPEQQLG